MYLTYLRTQLHSDRLAENCTPFQRLLYYFIVRETIHHILSSVKQKMQVCRAGPGANALRSRSVIRGRRVLGDETARKYNHIGWAGPGANALRNLSVIRGRPALGNDTARKYNRMGWANTPHTASEVFSSKVTVENLLRAIACSHAFLHPSLHVRNLRRIRYRMPLIRILVNAVEGRGVMRLADVLRIFQL